MQKFRNKHRCLPFSLPLNFMCCRRVGMTHAIPIIEYELQLLKLFYCPTLESNSTNIGFRSAYIFLKKIRFNLDFFSYICLSAIFCECVCFLSHPLHLIVKRACTITIGLHSLFAVLFTICMSVRACDSEYILCSVACYIRCFSRTLTNLFVKFPLWIYRRNLYDRITLNYILNSKGVSEKIPTKTTRCTRLLCCAMRHPKNEHNLIISL